MVFGGGGGGLLFIFIVIRSLSSLQHISLFPLHCLLAPLGLAPVALGFGGLIYAVVALLGGLAMVAFSIQVLRHREGEAEKRAAMGMFGFSILDLFALFSALLAEQSFGLFRAVIA